MQDLSQQRKERLLSQALGTMGTKQQSFPSGEAGTGTKWLCHLSGVKVPPIPGHPNPAACREHLRGLSSVLPSLV